ncbi:methyltransferase family protein [Nocardia fluminea]|uniref:Protein-S-isoprenylcysteine O-methyltransferase Ste14 n=1 Tax=Nocardia fluminea TaxID=134984 RepID=A0A2N3V6B2_9NOCA|nr:isoprenylcysteine carboxylmethyltransferase family protein [Nocardia fluminea]PKV76666.1 protein-S-isoprenylcysteine O-methyltransferase Ste14 [Nocardia fluminea]PKV77121.1 protein-S-isoprenylcysteine O-methyltransferase Ste14 [Nocardia fluminea]
MTAWWALALYLIFAALGFGWRSWRQHRATGSTGFRGTTGRPGSLEWIAGVGFPVGIAIGVAAPLLQLADLVAPVTSLTSGLIQGIGLVTALAGIAATVYAQNEMGDSWRIGVDDTETTTLVRTGVFGLVRNPIFTAMLLFSAGITLLIPNPVSIAGFVVLLTAIELQVRIVEEPYLARVHGSDYKAYLTGVGRFAPGIGRARA